MLKWIIGFFLFLLLIGISIYFFISDQVQLSEIVSVSVPQEGTYRVLADQKGWAQWWPGTIDTTGTNDYRYKYDQAIYQITQNRFNGVDLVVHNEEITIPGSLILVSLARDSTAIAWQGMMTTSTNPFQRINQYIKSKKLEKDISNILTRLRSYLSKQKNVYGNTIQQTKVKDTVLIATRKTTPDYPTTEAIYNLVHKLRQYIAVQGAAEINPPMLHVTQLDSSRYETMVAIPVNKRLPERDGFLQKRMVPGNILVTEVKGGPAAIKQAFTQLENYVSDYRKESPAIPFESLVTDRMEEKDTTKWITRIYYPVF